MRGNKLFQVVVKEIIISSGDTINIVNKISATIDNDYSVERMAAVLGAATQSKLLTKRGKSKFRMRCRTGAN